METMKNFSLNIYLYFIWVGKLHLSGELCGHQELKFICLINGSVFCKNSQGE